MQMENLLNYLNQIDRFKLLTPEEEKKLAFKMQNKDLSAGEREAARDQLINHNLRLVVKVAYSFINRGLDLEDLVQFGNLGLIAAVDNFDPTRGRKLSTYATWKIRGYIKHNLERNQTVIRISQPMIQLMKHTSQTMREEGLTTEECMADPDAKRRVWRGVQKRLEGKNTNIVKKAANLTQERVQLAMELLSRTYLSLDQQVGDSNLTLSDNIETVLHQAARERPFSELEHTILEYISLLPEIQKEILIIRFGLMGGIAEPVEGVSEILGITIQEVEEHEREAIQHLRQFSGQAEEASG